MLTTAVDTMADHTPWLPVLALLPVLVPVLTEPTVFLPAPRALGLLSRARRAGPRLLEELFEGDLERECFEEICTLEEAREVFEDEQRTDDFWKRYMGGSPCVSQPCLNNGTCQDHVRGYSCSCSSGFEGPNCAFAKQECHPLRTDGCQHFCHPGEQAYTCSCAQGHRLGEDRKACEPLDQCACGVPTPGDQADATAPAGCVPRVFPWQVTLEDGEGTAFCAGVLLQEAFALTTARCALLHANISVRAGAPGAGAEPRWVSRWHVHPGFSPGSPRRSDYDVAVLELDPPLRCVDVGPPVCLPEWAFAERVLVPGSAGLLTGWTLRGPGPATPAQLPVTALDGRACATTLGTPPGTRLSCERPLAASGARWWAGSTVVRWHRGAWFLTGLLGGVPGEGTPGTPQGALLLTRVPRLALWLRQVTK
ncbi:vitamin K-dependent protein Z isoform X2 [Erinaceus europaeus]|nr:vitamin K-dependent protein Z isoform X2 [Erinaceus europaeus]XP_016049959.1 vitamin K-dependent protein Z isoform X2 [Erinaceus europaeus]